MLKQTYNHNLLVCFSMHFIYMDIRHFNVNVGLSQGKQGAGPSRSHFKNDSSMNTTLLPYVMRCAIWYHLYDLKT